MKIIECEQGTPEWHKARAGAITASMFSEVRKRLKSGPNKGDYTSEGHKYAQRLAIERIAGDAMEFDQFETWAMRRGKELEHDARLAHEARLGHQVMIEQVGIVLTDDGKFGASADGFIGDDGGAEYKCLLAPDRITQVVLDGDYSEFADQVQGCLWLTGRNYWHFVVYMPFLKAAGKEMFIHRIDRDEDYIAELEKDLLAFDYLVETYKAKIIGADTGIDLTAK